MHRYPIFYALLLSGCMGSEPMQVVAPPPVVPADLLQPAPGYAGSAPETEGQLSTALIAEARGRRQANAQLTAISEILNTE